MIFNELIIYCSGDFSGVFEQLSYNIVDNFSCIIICFSSTSMLNSVIAEPTTASQLTTAKESSIKLLLNNVKRYLSDASIVIGIITPNGTQVYGYGKYI
jgi:hypothetical protein